MAEQKLDDDFLAMLESNRGLIYKVCFFYASEDFPVADLYQDTVCNLWRSYASFRGESAPSTWIYRIALNTCISAVRKVSRRPRHVELSPFTESVTQPEAWDSEAIGELYRLIRGLRTMERAVVMLWLEEKTYQEIASITGLSVSNVATLLSRAKEKLKKMSNS